MEKFYQEWKMTKVILLEKAEKKDMKEKDEKLYLPNPKIGILWAV